MIAPRGILSALLIAGGLITAALSPAPTGADVGDAQLRTARSPVIAIDPGHGGPEVGAVSPEGDLAEKDVNLRIALRLATLLKADGYQVVLTRDSDRAVDTRYVGAGYPTVRYDLQARVDIANEAGALLFLSLHNNGGPASEAGTEVWYSQERAFGDRNRVLAESVQAGIVGSLRTIGYNPRDRGIKDDSTFRIFRGQAYNIYVLGPGTGPRSHVPTAMPGVLGESLFLSNPTDAAMLRQPATLDAIARGYRTGVRTYLAAFPIPAASDSAPH